MPETGVSNNPQWSEARELLDEISPGYLGRPDVAWGRMFGSDGLRVRNKVFAFAGHEGLLIVKLPEARVDELVTAGEAERMVMRGRPMREWACAPVSAGRARWESLVAEAFTYLDEITPRLT